MDGIELVTKISRINPDILTVFISAYADFSYAQKAISLKVVDYILKPILPIKVEECCLKLKNVLDKRNLSEPDINYKTLYS
ncbi:MAG: response regulator, partial [Bacteroidaceae bacterium]|nr:response regulator [Bacteroidaceae bacterium]